MTERFRAIQVSKSNDRIVLRFVSVETRNALSENVIAELEEFMLDCESDLGLRQVIITGTGIVFASGADLKEISALTPEAATGFARRGQALMRRVEELKCEAIAAINGFCYGGGLDLALACQRRIANSKATFCHPGVGLGIITGWGGTQRLTRLIGAAAACELLFTGEPISADRASLLGLIDEVNDQFFDTI